MRAARFRKRPLVVEAMRWDSPQATQRLLDWVDGDPEIVDSLTYDPLVTGPAGVEGTQWGALSILSPSGVVVLTPGDWLVKGLGGAVYRRDAEVFAATYDAETEAETEGHTGS